MEPMTGLELCSVMAEEYPQIKFILLTGYYNFNDAYQAIKFGVVEFLLKPTSPTQIASAIKRAITKIKEQDITNMLYSEIQQQATENLALKQSLLLQNILMGTDYGDELPQLLEDASIDLFCYYCIAIQAYRRKGEEKTPKFYTNVRSTFAGTSLTYFHHINSILLIWIKLSIFSSAGTTAGPHLLKPYMPAVSSSPP